MEKLEISRKTIINYLSGKLTEEEEDLFAQQLYAPNNRVLLDRVEKYETYFITNNIVSGEEIKAYINKDYAKRRRRNSIVLPCVLLLPLPFLIWNYYSEKPIRVEKVEVEETTTKSLKEGIDKNASLVDSSKILKPIPIPVREPVIYINKEKEANKLDIPKVSTPTQYEPIALETRPINDLSQSLFLEQYYRSEKAKNRLDSLKEEILFYIEVNKIDAAIDSVNQILTILEPGKHYDRALLLKAQLCFKREYFLKSYNILDQYWNNNRDITSLNAFSLSMLGHCSVEIYKDTGNIDYLKLALEKFKTYNNFSPLLEKEKISKKDIKNLENSLAIQKGNIKRE